MRFFRRGKSKIYIVPSVAGDSPTSAELAAGTDISGDVAGISGFGLTNTPIVTPDLGTAFNSQIEGEDAAEDCSLTFYDDDGVGVLRDLLAKGTECVVILMPYGKIATKRCEKWPVKSTGFNDTWSMDAAAAQAVCTFAVREAPVQDGVVPAPA